MNPLLSAAAIITSIGTIGGGAIYLDHSHVSRTEYEKFAGRVEASQYLTTLVQMGAYVNAKGQVLCKHLPPKQRGTCVYLRARYNDARKRR